MKIEDIKVTVGTIATFGLSLLPTWVTMNIIKDIVTISVGITTIAYTVVKIVREGKDKNKSENN